MTVAPHGAAPSAVRASGVGESMSEQCRAYVFVPFAEARRGRRRCRNWTTHHSGLCWLHRNPTMPDDERKDA
jgi:hypothetical protein